MYRVTFEDNDYIFTQMEAMYARRAFPLLDEPAMKVPFTLTIEAPEDLVVVANTPVESSSRDGEWQRVMFMETPPLPSYLIAYALGPLDYAELEGISIPGRVYVPKGHADELGFVLRETPKILAALEDYFGSDYRFRKMDFVAVPEFAFGAMENPGLITYRTDILLVGDEASGNQAAQVLNIIAHEIAHIWYGDVVTMAWWDDLWLNEAFATWMANTILENVYPQYETVLNLPQQGAFANDELTTSKPIRRVVRNNDEIFESVGLNYSKGHALLRMLERYVGPEVWQRAIRKYVETYAWSNATEKDLWAIVSDESGIDVSGIAGDFLNQPGFAVISVDDKGRVRQERYVREGLEVEDMTWRLPLNVKYKADGEIRQTFMLFDKRRGELDVPRNADWVFPDAGGNGYYRWSTSDEQFYNLIDDFDELSAREKIALLDNTEALLNNGALTMADYLYVLERLFKDPHPLVFLPALEKLKLIGEEFVDASTEESFAAFIDRSLGPRYKEVGIEQKQDDTEAVLRLRPRLVRALGQFGSDARLIEEASAMVDQYFDSADSIQSEMALEAMRVTAMNDDGGRYDDYQRIYLDSDIAGQKSNILSAIYFQNPEVVRRHLDFTLTDEVQAGDSLTGLSLYAYVLEDHSLLYEWLDENFDALLAKVPGAYAPMLPQFVASSCRQDNLDRLVAFFESRGEQYAPSLAKARETQESCIARRDRHVDAFREFLESR
jgi:aminopeptidase N